jgi:hypothetical protein
MSSTEKPWRRRLRGQDGDAALSAATIKRRRRTAPTAFSGRPCQREAVERTLRQICARSLACFGRDQALAPACKGDKALVGNWIFYAHPTPDRRTSIRNHQGVDGRDPLQAAHPRKGQRGDGPSRSRLQSEAGNRHLRGAAAHPGDEGRLSPSPYENLTRQQTQLRFRAVPA